MTFVHIRIALAASLTLALGCARTPEASTAVPAPTVDSPAVPDSEPSPGDGTTTSVRPGVNDKYLDEGALELWTERFEHTEREVIANRDAIVEHLGLRPGDVVADIGAGTGSFSRALSEAVGGEGRVLATDITPTFLARLRELAGELPNLEVVEGLARDAMLPAGAVDVALMVDVYHHLEFPAAFLPTVHEALAADGVLVVVDFRRVEGVTSESMMKHIRAGQEVVRAEIEAAGFVHDGDLAQLDENYVMRFRVAR